MNETLSVIAKNPLPFIIAIGIFFLGIGIFFLVRWLRKKKGPKPLGAAAIKDMALEAKPPEKKPKKGKEVTFTKEGVVKESIEIGPQYPYKAVIRRYPQPGRTPVIEFGNRISKPLGDTVFCEPSCPITGEAYYIEENADHTFSPYDPRSAAILSDKTPYHAWDATHWPEAEGVWVFEKNWMEKISSILMWVCLAAMFLIVLVKIGG